jgi:hypothetical protein
VNALLQSLEIDRNAELEHRMHGPMGGAFNEFEDYWNEGAPPGQMGHPDQWAAEFDNKLRLGGQNQWADEFARENGSGGTWAEEFGQVSPFSKVLMSTLLMSTLVFMSTFPVSHRECCFTAI